ncbi:acetyl/propionyl/methylcrotonyl-CoA carboxylase subunit alpha [Spelaeicoccus albus]|uniref:biotin carboxylase n=1 Tax=Spelaeicoccus albus TaxID=1280376 RepID=A0A7Z0A783_9MICO|nr:acetyl/propionyl/methylcrotonyl-CoA carboxylase subunit alpha [Spelaeicoccus albus]NYI65704.1 acetyl-CoA/propionyl-CoA carboxylase biotin carboxyl carrier protein [Spelaeicoccus albus]
MLKAVLIANRGEIAVRVIRTVKKLGLTAIAVYSDADAGARHVREADLAVRLGPASAAESYLDINKVIEAAVRTGADAIHPGYGFLSENTDFARACEAAGIVFVGPPASAIEVMGDKITAKRTVSARGVPLVPGISRPGLTDAELEAGAAEIGYPVLVKPSAGGGGKGMREVDDPAALPEALAGSRRESRAAFGDDTLFIERLVRRPRHIEVQILADTHGNVVHLGERECSLQRRHQKVIEEAPSPLLDDAIRNEIGSAACETARSVGYVGVGTVEFIVSDDAPGDFFFMEMNTRLQVEHPVTEFVTGLDLVEWQLRVASGEPLDFTQEDVTLTGHAMEARVYAEDASRGFLPSAGTIIRAVEPAGEGVRVDSSASDGMVVGTDYDPMLAKVIAYAPDRAGALAKLDKALSDTAMPGVVTNIDFLRFLLADEDVRAGRLRTTLIDDRLPGFSAPSPPPEAWAAAALAKAGTIARAGAGSLWAGPDGWRVGAHAGLACVFESAGGRRTVHVHGDPARADALVRIDDDEPVRARLDSDGLVWAGVRSGVSVDNGPDGVWVTMRTGTFRLTEPARLAGGDDGQADQEGEILSPMPGTVIAVPAEPGGRVEAGNPVVIVEAMKMEHVLSAPVAGNADIAVRAGDKVGVDQLLATIIGDEK